MAREFTGVFVAEGSSDAPLADIVELLFLRSDCAVNLSRPDFSSLNVQKDVQSRIAAALRLIGSDVDLIVVHRDADGTGTETRFNEICSAHRGIKTSGRILPVIPVRMTEAWLLLDEPAIRHVAGNPNGRSQLNLPAARSVERIADPKEVLKNSILTAASVTGRRKERLSKRFGHSRRQLLEKLDLDGPINHLKSWQGLVDAVSEIAAEWRVDDGSSRK